MNHTKQAIDDRLAALLKEWDCAAVSPLPAAGDYVGFVATPLGAGKSLVSISGQVPVEKGKLVVGKVGDNLDEAAGAAAARLCALALLAQLQVACGGDLSRVRRCVRLGGFVCAVEGFGNHPEVINGASSVMTALFGERGKHARFAVGAAHLPRGVPVEVEALFLIDDA